MIPPGIFELRIAEVGKRKLAETDRAWATASVYQLDARSHFAIEQPDDVDVGDIVIRPTAQG
jgi:hypothetical protein